MTLVVALGQDLYFRLLPRSVFPAFQPYSCIVFQSGLGPGETKGFRVYGIHSKCQQDLDKPATIPAESKVSKQVGFEYMVGQTQVYGGVV